MQQSVQDSIIDQDNDIYEQIEQKQFISITDRYNMKIAKLVQSRKRMDMGFNYKIKNKAKGADEDEKKEEKPRKTRKDQEGRKYICGCLQGYLSYPALYTHIKTKHGGIEPVGTVKGENGRKKKRGRPKNRVEPTIHQKIIEQEKFPKALLDIVEKQYLLLNEYDLQKPEDQNQLTAKYFTDYLRKIKRDERNQIKSMAIGRIITIFLYNIKDIMQFQTLLQFEKTLLKLIAFINKNHESILDDYAQYSRIYVVNQPCLGQYCDQSTPFYLPVFISYFIRNETDDMNVALLYDLARWLRLKKITLLLLARDRGHAIQMQNQQATHFQTV